MRGIEEKLVYPGYLYKHKIMGTMLTKTIKIMFYIVTNYKTLIREKIWQ